MGAVAVLVATAAGSAVGVDTKLLDQRPQMISQRCVGMPTGVVRGSSTATAPGPTSPSVSLTLLEVAGLGRPYTPVLQALAFDVPSGLPLIQEWFD